MYNGYWEIHKSYRRGDVVYVATLAEYYICIQDHISDSITFPNKEDLYWVYLSNNFLHFFKSIEQSQSNTDEQNKYKYSVSIDNLVDNLVDNVINSEFDILYKTLSKKSVENPKIYRKQRRSVSYELIKDAEIIQENLKKNELKRKIKTVEDEIEHYKRQKTTHEGNVIESLRNKLLCMDLDIEKKSFLLDKYESAKDMNSSDYSKTVNWLKTVVKIPYGKYKGLKVKSTDSIECLQEFFKEVKEKLDRKIYGLENVKQEILEFVARKITNPNSKGHVLALYGNPGVGKCFEKDTQILMFDGSIKVVQNIKVGDLLMGDDSTPRKVLALGSGKDIMYKITNIKGESYTVNSEHILCLKYTKNKFITNDKNNKRFKVIWFDNNQIKLNTKNFSYKSDNVQKMNIQNIYKKAYEYLENIKEEKICEISVKEYLKLPKYMKKNLKGYSVPIDFKEIELEFDPYIIGFWLGNETKNDSAISCQDASVLKYLAYNLPNYDCYLAYKTQYEYEITELKNSSNQIVKCNTFLNILQKNKMINNKHIPLVYKCNSRENRLKLLAGLLDSSGGSLHHCKSGYEFCQTNETLIDDVIYLCKSLGLSCYKQIKSTSWAHKETGFTFKVFISGNGIEEIPVLCSRKKANLGKQIKDSLVSGIRVEKLQEDNYYGFMIDGNERLVLGNFIVTHNTKIIRSLADALDLPFYQINFGGLNDVSVLTGHSETYIGSKPGKIAEIFTSCNYMNPIVYLDEIDKVSESKANEIFGTLTHLLDEEQNSEFQDNYLSNVTIDLSKVFFVIAFNDISKVDSIVSDRLKVIYIDPPTIQDKIIIAQDKMIPSILETIRLKNDYNIVLESELIEYIITCKTTNEQGVRQLQKNIEKIVNRLNYDILIDNLKLIKKEGEKTLIITKSYIDKVITSQKDDDKSYLEMYI